MSKSKNKKVEDRMAARQKDAAEKKAKRDAARAAKKAKGKADDNGVAETVAAVEKGNLAEGITVPEAKKDRPFLLTLAAECLKVNAQADGCNCQTMVEYALAHGWQTEGKTPAATLSSAILTEIKKKGADSRFVKVGRGLFKHS